MNILAVSLLLSLSAAAQSVGSATGPASLNELAQEGLRQQAEDQARAACAQPGVIECVTSSSVACDPAGCKAEAKAWKFLPMLGGGIVHHVVTERSTMQGAPFTPLELEGLRRVAQEQAIKECKAAAVGNMHCAALGAKPASCSGPSDCEVEAVAGGYCIWYPPTVPKGRNGC